MTTEMMVPISHDGPVMPGEEVDVAVEMTAPADLGRYLGYWRLVGPHGRRKFGQRVWCHVQVVDQEAEGVVSDEELSRTRAEIEQKKDEIAAREECNDNETDAGDAADEQTDPAAGASSAASGVAVAVAEKPVVPPPSPAA